MLFVRRHSRAFFSCSYCIFSKNRLKILCIFSLIVSFDARFLILSARMNMIGLVSQRAQVKEKVKVHFSFPSSYISKKIYEKIMLQLSFDIMKSLEFL